ncbi:arginase family-domain-containing protein [Rhizoctonia solani]|nr:arginase family-domain-containing protein [Rhizoctonia solani]
MTYILVYIAASIAFASAQTTRQTWAEKYGPQEDMPFSGPLSFAHLPYSKCLEATNSSQPFDIAILGVPFDSAVTYRPGARFGPYGIRSGSRRISPYVGYTTAWGYSPYEQNTTIMDCGDVPTIPFDILKAVDQIDTAYSTLINLPVVTETNFGANITRNAAKDGKPHPRVMTLGGDHAIILPILRSLHSVYGEIAVVHFDSHLDTWPTEGFYGASNNTITHGTMFWTAMNEGLIAKGNSIHAGIRCMMTGYRDIQHDQQVGFSLITTDDIEELGTDGIIQAIKRRVADKPVYISIDIDVVDPALAPATGTPEPGGWTTREVKRILRGLAGMNIIGADLVEVAPAYDTNAESTTLVAAGIVHDLLSVLIGREPSRVSFANSESASGPRRRFS